MRYSDQSLKLKARLQEFRGAFKSRQAFLHSIQTNDTSLDQHGHTGSTTWSNEDLDPTPPEKRSKFRVITVAKARNTATLITNQPDIARWSKTKQGAMWSQLITNPIAVTLSASLGILSTAAINNTWGLELWNQWDLLDAIMTRYWSSSARFAVFLSAFTWMVSILGTNIAANMIPFGSDSSMLFPRYITIPRGQFLVELLGFAICPWKILASASVFTTFLSGYGLFMASVVAIMICDYFLLTKGNVFIGSLYDGSSWNKHYYYTRGWNIQAVIAYISGIALPFPGFVGTLGPTVSKPAQDMGHLGWLLSFFTSFIIYYLICLVWPTGNQKLIKEMNITWEEESCKVIVAEDGTEVREGSIAEETEKGLGYSPTVEPVKPV
ncbi:MAG: hypothetical protein M1834_000672 [Cirrosporium novae-zelandiae]|nr:MAG: hypothetical protein M1834_000672 [Cirrosporium novae-zelandiae]